MGEKLRRIVNNKKNLNFLVAICIIIYAVLFCYFFFFSYLSYSEIAIDDKNLQRGIDASNEIVIIEITEESEDILNSSYDTIAATLVKEINEKSGNVYAISLDTSISDFSKEAVDILCDIDDDNNDIILCNGLTVEDGTTIDAFDLKKERFEAIKSNIPVNLKFENFTFGHNIKIIDANGVLRHAVFDVSVLNDSNSTSLPYECYKVYCEKKGIEFVEPNLLSNETALIQFSDDEYKTYNATDFLNGDVSYYVLNEKIVLVSYVDSEYSSGFITSLDYSTRMSGAVIDANIINNLIKGEFVVEVPIRVQCIIIFLLIILMSIVVSKGTFFETICVVGIYELSIQIGCILLNGIGYSIMLLPHISNGLLTSGLLVCVVQMIRESKRKQNVEKVLEKYLDENIAKGLIKGDEDHLYDEIDIDEGYKKEISVIFADLRNFTAISEKIESSLLVTILNEYLSMMSDCIIKYGGTVDKFIGDCVMAYWGAPNSDEDAVYHACLAATEMQRKSKYLAEKIKDKYSLNINIDMGIGIGINYGEAIIGSVGSENRMNFTVLGDAVNTASRLESMAPIGEVYMSQVVVDKLRQRGEYEKLGKDIFFKGKEKAVPVYKLKSLTVKNSNKKAGLNRPKYFEYHKKRGLYALLINLLLFLIHFVFIANTIRTSGLRYMSFFPLLLAILSAIALLLVMPYDLKAITNADGINRRPKWMDILYVTMVSCDLHSFVILVVNLVPTYGLIALYDNPWPGGFMTYVVCPILALLNFYNFETMSKYSIGNLVISDLPIIITLILSAIFADNIGFDIENPDMYNAFYSHKGLPLIIVLGLIGNVVLGLINNKVMLKHNGFVQRITAFGGLIGALKNTWLAVWIGIEANSHKLAIIFNTIILCSSIKTIITAIGRGGISIYSNPSLICIVISVCTIISIIFHICCLNKEDFQSKNKWHIGVSFARNLGCFINFATILLVVVSGGGLKAFFEPRWNGDWTVFLLCPILSMLMIMNERYRAKLSSCILISIPFTFILPLSKYAIYSSGLIKKYEYEISNFYETRMMIVIAFAEIMAACILYFAKASFDRVKDASDSQGKETYLHICGTRSSVSSQFTESEYGLKSSCYIFKDRDYAIVFKAGSGMLYTSHILRNCKKVDVIINDDSFSSVMGYMQTSSITPKAKVRVFSKGDISKLSEKPYWPVNLIKDKIEPIVPFKKVKLSNSYSCKFIPVNEEKTSYIVNIEGPVNICFMSEMSFKLYDNKEFGKNIDLLIYDGYKDWKQVCYTGIDINIPNIIVSGYNYSMGDDYISRDEFYSKRIVSDVTFAREERKYFVK